MSRKPACRSTDFRWEKHRFHDSQCRQIETLDTVSSCLSYSSGKQLHSENSVHEYKAISNEKNDYRIINIDISISDLSNYLVCTHCKSISVLKERVVFE